MHTAAFAAVKSMHMTLCSDVQTDSGTQDAMKSWRTIMDAIIRKIVDSELTPRQREIYLLYYEYGMAQFEIAEKLHMNKSTIFRTLQRAEKAVDRIMRYVRMARKEKTIWG